MIFDTTPTCVVLPARRVDQAKTWSFDDRPRGEKDDTGGTTQGPLIVSEASD